MADISKNSKAKTRKVNSKRMSFVDFNILFLTCSKLDNVEVSVYAPIIYTMKNKYFNAVVKYLKTGEQVVVSYKNYSTEKIINSYVSKPNYIQAVVILNNLEQSSANAPIIFNPDIVE